MKIDIEDRLLSAKPAGNRPWIAIVIVVAAVVSSAVVFSPGLRELAVSNLRSVGSATGAFQSPRQEFADALQRLGIADLSNRVLASDKIVANLSALTREKCDRTAIYGLGEALVAEREQRAAAYAYFGFAATCPNGENEEYRAAELLLNLGDPAKTIAICDALIKQNPGVANYRYVRGKALAAANRYQEALVDYRSTIELQKDPRLLRAQFFTEMANVFAALGQGCNAAKTILAWVALDPTTRNTTAARKMVQEYAGRDCRSAVTPGDIGNL